MKKDQNKRNILIIIIVVLILVLLLVILFAVNNHKPKTNGNNYVISSKEKELNGTEEHTSEKLKSSHCVDKVCVENVSIYYNGSEGRVEYTIYNKSSKEVSGNLMMVFGDDTILVAYSKLGAKGKIETSSFFTDKNISDKDDYVLRKLTKEEEKKIIKK